MHPHCNTYANGRGNSDLGLTSGKLLCRLSKSSLSAMRAGWRTNKGTGQVLVRTSCRKDWLPVQCSRQVSPRGSYTTTGSVAERGGVSQSQNTSSYSAHIHGRKKISVCTEFQNLQIRCISYSSLQTILVNWL